MIRPSGRYLIEPAPEGARVTLNPHPEVRGVGKIMAPLIGIMIKRLNQKHLDALRQAVEGRESFDRDNGEAAAEPKSQD